MVEEADIGSLSEASTVIAITPGGAHGELDPPSGRLIRNILIPRPALPFGLLAGISSICSCPPKPIPPASIHSSKSNWSMPDEVSSSSTLDMRCSRSVRTSSCPSNLTGT